MAKGTVNKVILVGRLGADPDIRYSASGTAVAKVNIATVDRVLSGNNEWEDRTEWNRVVAFGKQAEFLGTYAKKGKPIYIEGTLRTNQWEDKEGVKRYTTEIMVRDIQLIGGNGEGSSGQSSTSGNKGGFSGGGKSVKSSDPFDVGDDVPF